jgi:hypothetical protein
MSESKVVEIERQVLAYHDTIATFSGIKHQRCMHMTSLCPDQCNHGGDYAVFTIIEYLKHEKPGQYGEDKMPQYHLKLVKSDASLQPFLKTIESLQLNDKVHLIWQHDYVTRQYDGNGTSKSPERPPKLIEKME